MTEDDYWTALGRRAVACERWEWRAGMLIHRGYRVTRVDSDGNPIAENGTRYSEIPDLRDDATKGALLGLVREAWDRKPEPAPSYVLPLFGGLRANEPGGWRCRAGMVDFDADTEAEALVAALEHAP